MKYFLVFFPVLFLFSSGSLSQQIIENLTFNPQKGYYVLDYRYKDSLDIFKGTIMPNNNVNPEVTATVTLNESALYQYEYKLKNDASALQPLLRFSLISKELMYDIQSPNELWLGLYADRIGRVVWSKSRASILGIIPGDSSSTFSYISSHLPKIAISFSENSSWISFPNEKRGPFGKLDSIIDSLNTNGVKKLTLGPWLPDSTMSLEAFIDTLETFRFRSCEELDWATNTTVCGTLEDQLSDVKASLSTGDSLSVANTLQDFLELVEAEKDQSLTSEGYALLYFNGKYLADRLPEPQDSGVGSDITCGCDNPVTQTSGTIAIQNGETRCLNQTFSGSVFFQSGGTLNVCSTATFQNVSGNQPGIIQVNETGDVSVGNWNNNYSQDGFTNWGTTTFSNWTTINQGTLTNNGTMSIGGGLNQNNGPLINNGALTVTNSVNLNKTGNQNTGEFTVGGTLTLNSNAELSNTCRVEASQQLMVNGTLINQEGGFISSGGQLTINSNGQLVMNGANAMVTAGQIMLNGAISVAGQSNLLQVLGSFNYNSGSAITTTGVPLFVDGVNLTGLPAEFQVTAAGTLNIPPSTCNPNGFGN